MPTSRPPRAVFFFCADLDLDPVASRVFERSREIFPLEETGDAVDGMPVLLRHDEAGREFAYVRTADVLSHAYERYLPVLNERFADFDLALVVNWHEGANAPDAILMAHTTADVVSGNFGPADAALTTAMLRALERERVRAGLDGYTTVTEATHWSGIPHGSPPELIARYPVPVLDVEIGSTPERWSDPAAVEVVARAIAGVFDAVEADAASLLCVGGVHFEPAFREAVLAPDRPHRVAVSHILANQWLAGYDGAEGAARLDACVRSIAGGVDAVVFHDNVKGPVKAAARELAERLGVPVFKHRRLRQPEPLEIDPTPRNTP